MRKFADAGYAQLLLHPSERKLAIRPCQESAMHSIPWRSGAAKSLYAKTLCCRHFGAALFRIMEWDPDFLYRVRGTWIQRGEEQIIIYNLEHAVSAVLLPQMREAPGRETRAECFPEPWEDSFGEEFYDHIMGNEAFYMARGTAWQAGRPSVLAPGIGQYVPQTGGEFQKMMETLRRKAASGDGG